MRPEFLLAFPLLLIGCPVIGDDDDNADDDDGPPVACSTPGDRDDETPVDFRVWSPDFIPDDAIDHEYDCDQALPVENACDGPSPEICWEGVPDGATTLTLIFDDPTAGNFPHWAIYNVPADENGLAPALSGDGIDSDLPGDAQELTNGFGGDGYLGSCPGGVNHYRWRLWAIDGDLDTPDPGSASQEYARLGLAAEEAAIDVVSMCHVFDGGAL